MDHNDENSHEPTQDQRETPEKNRPVETLRDGNLKASIWANQGEHGPTYQTTFARSWRDDQGQWHDSQSYSGTDLLRLQELSRSAYHRTNELRREQAQERSQSPARDTNDRNAFREQRSAPSRHEERERDR